MFTKEQATRRAEEEFARQGLAVSEHTVTVETYHADPDEWIVWFDQNGPFPVPGGKHAVLVNKTTGRVEFMPGE